MTVPGRMRTGSTMFILPSCSTATYSGRRKARYGVRFWFLPAKMCSKQLPASKATSTKNASLKFCMQAVPAHARTISSSYDSTLPTRIFPNASRSGVTAAITMGTIDKISVAHLGRLTYTAPTEAAMYSASAMPSQSSSRSSAMRCMSRRRISLCFISFTPNARINVYMSK